MNEPVTTLDQRFSDPGTVATGWQFQVHDGGFTHEGGGTALVLGHAHQGPRVHQGPLQPDASQLSAG
jgi:hypothetical protein